MVYTNVNELLNDGYELKGQFKNGVKVYTMNSPMVTGTLLVARVSKDGNVLGTEFYEKEMIDILK
ncbi:hypothetical protein [Bacillus infantis]|uniref:hypothetical protein n=1 Tax=Bacillus infantis TaxID=324767 RepID=UPI0020A01B05|nr:hypothetical protein [Bacillus infantis]MCP1159360.1 hypothetical protein [Bacillus infantis]